MLETVTVTVDSPDTDQPFTILEDISCQLTGGRTAVLGLNGSGKSTLLKLINGLQAPASGSVQVGGVEVAEHLAFIRQKVGFLFANPAAQLVMPTPLEDVELSLRNLISDREERLKRAQDILDSLQVGHRSHHSVYDLSGGERQLVALATVLAVEPAVLLLDEPTTLLDLRNRLRLHRLLDTLDQQLIISTHDLELAATCETAIVIHGGRIIAQGAAHDVIEQYTHWCANNFPDGA